MKMLIKEFADLTNVSVRTLHYYDEIGLLKADYIDEHNGYRYYGEPALSRMQEILFYRELNFPLKDILMILSSPEYNKQEALKKQKHLLVLKKERLERIINTIERIEKGEKTMDFNAFDNSKFDEAMEKYKKEAQKRWGNTEAFKESEKRTAGYSKEKWNEVNAGLNSIIDEFSKLCKNGVSESDDSALLVVCKLKTFITENQYTCTDEILLGLGQMYTCDERFKAYIDKNYKGTAEFINKAIIAYCSR